MCGIQKCTLLDIKFAFKFYPRSSEKLLNRQQGNLKDRKSILEETQTHTTNIDLKLKSESVLK